jgi:hypothetical protein
LMARKIKKRNKKMKIFFKKTLQLGETLSLSLLILYFVFIFSYLLFARQCRRIRRRRRRQTQFITGDSVIIYKVSWPFVGSQLGSITFHSFSFFGLFWVPATILCLAFALPHWRRKSLNVLIKRIERKKRIEGVVWTYTTPFPLWRRRIFLLLQPKVIDKNSY